MKFRDPVNTERKARFYRPRLLPVLVAVGGVLFGFKVMAVWQGTEAVVATLGTPALAEDKPAETAPEKHQAEAAAAPAKGAPAPAQTDSKCANGAGGGGEDPSASELELLQSLGKRRDELAARERALDLRETMLKAAEQRVDQKVSRLAELKSDIQKLVQQNDQAEDARIDSLVKVYEAMKPKDAARIFEKLDQSVLLEVTARMKESRMAPILAAMEPSSAQAVTVALATRRTLPDAADSAASEAPDAGSGG